MEGLHAWLESCAAYSSTERTITMSHAITFTFWLLTWLLATSGATPSPTSTRTTPSHVRCLGLPATDAGSAGGCATH